MEAPNIFKPSPKCSLIEQMKKLDGGRIIEIDLRERHQTVEDELVQILKSDPLISLRAIT